MGDVKRGSDMKELVEQVAEIEEKLHRVEILVTPYGLAKGAEELLHHVLEGRRHLSEGLAHLKRAQALMDEGHGQVGFGLKLGGSDDAVDG